MFPRIEKFGFTDDFGPISLGFRNFFDQLEQKSPAIISNSLCKMGISIPLESEEDAFQTGNVVSSTSLDIDFRMGVATKEDGNRVELVEFSSSVQFWDGPHTTNMLMATIRNPKDHIGLRDLYLLGNEDRIKVPVTIKILEKGLKDKRVQAPVFILYQQEDSAHTERGSDNVTAFLEAIVMSPNILLPGSEQDKEPIKLPIDKISMGLMSRGFSTQNFIKEMTVLTQGEPADITHFDLSPPVVELMKTVTGRSNYDHAQWIHDKETVCKYPFYPEMPENK